MAVTVRDIKALSDAFSTAAVHYGDNKMLLDDYRKKIVDAMKADAVKQIEEMFETEKVKDLMFQCYFDYTQKAKRKI
jgi:uncharacterized protein (DUF1015 family)